MRLSPVEVQAKREKGICFKCDEKWSLAHQCKKKELHVLLVSEGDEMGCASEDEGDHENENVEGVELSLNSVVGLSEPQTLKVKR